MDCSKLIFPIEKKDIIEHMRLRNIVSIQKFLRQVGDCTEASQNCWYEGLIKDKTRQAFSIKVDDSVVGGCCLLSIDLYKSHAEAGWFLNPEYQGKGHATLAVEQMLDFAFSTLNLHSVYALVYSDNYKGLSFVKKVGFSHAGILRERRNRGSHYVDEFVFDMLSKDFYGTRKTVA